MLRSMFSAISGLRAHQTKMDVTGNNIANVNTVGFKGSQTVFQDTLSQVIRAGGAPAADRGGTNPAQVGLGVKVAGDHHQLDPGRHPDHRPLDRLHDRGRRLLRDPRGHRELYTRAGSFDFDGDGQAGHPGRRDPAGLDGRRDGVVNPNGPIERPVGALRPDRQPRSRPRPASSRATSPPARPPATSFQTGITMYDSQGVGAEGLLQLHQGGRAPTPGRSTSSTPTAPTWSPARRVAFNAAGAMTTPAAPGTLAPFTPPAATFPSWTGPVTIDLSGHDPVRRREHRRRARARTATRSARCSPSSSATTARSPASTPTGCASRSASSPWPRSTTPAAWRRPAAAPSASASTPASAHGRRGRRRAAAAC